MWLHFLGLLPRMSNKYSPYCNVVDTVTSRQNDYVVWCSAGKRVRYSRWFEECLQGGHDHFGLFSMKGVYVTGLGKKYSRQVVHRKF